MLMPTDYVKENVSGKKEFRQRRTVEESFKEHKTKIFQSGPCGRVFF